MEFIDNKFLNDSNVNLELESNVNIGSTTTQDISIIFRSTNNRRKVIEAPSKIRKSQRSRKDMNFILILFRHKP